MRNMMLATLALALLLAAPVARVARAAPTGGSAQIIDAMGRTVGAATFTALASGGVQLHVQVAGFDPGPGGDHGVHVHAVGKCEAPAFTSAGGHFNPTTKQHGHANPAGAHSGDLPNLQFYPDGSGAYTVTTTAFTLADLADADGSALMIHAAPDDMVTDPSGNSGARIGCGVIVADTTTAAPAQPAAVATTAMTTVPAASTTAIRAAAATPPAAASAQIVDAMGRPVGSATFTALASGGVRVHVAVAGFDPGPGGDHGVHVHTVGKCEAPAFTSAGGHFNPGAKQHGLANPSGAHAGDLPNLQFYPDGSGSFTADTTAFTLKSLADADGSAIMIHAGPDDMLTDPSGNSGARIACGVIVADAAAQP